ncbi:MAG TPA: LysM peptidoglycan-binding domain-containing protein [Terriglobales bacterium]|nr:LysM peptidoglycan-binding domain-containing protein [Terriglobales bacterium]
MLQERLHRWVAVGFLALLVSCKTAEKKPANAIPAPNATAPTLPVPAAAAQEKVPIPDVDPVETLIAQVENAYQAGQAEYAAGHMEGARENFDRAFSVMLSSGFDIHSDERLQREFNKIVEGVNVLEIAALKQGDGFTEQKLEPAPIDEANSVTFPADPRLKAKAEAEVKVTSSDLPLMVTDEVAGYISYFSSRGRGVLERTLIRSGLYRDMILTVLKEEGVPQDLIYLAQAESGFHPLALSRAGARGMWQFMASRASGYGLERNWWVDERQDPEKSTRAAARHLHDLYNQFGDWYLAMAAYNSGPGTVQSAVQRTGYADFWELYRRNVLPQETKNYVPIILAVILMTKNPEQYGLQELQLEKPEAFDRVMLDYPLDIRLAAECVDSTTAKLQELNPSLLRMTTPREGRFELRLPAGSAARFQQAIASIPKEMRVSWRYHKVGEGETLAAISRQYRTTPAAIREVNNLESPELRAESRLIIPVTPGKASLEANSFSASVTRYKVRKGDTVLSVADDFGVPPERLRRWNGLKGNSIKAGRMLRIYRPMSSPDQSRSSSPIRKTSAKIRTSNKIATHKGQAAQARRVFHKVAPGESLTTIAGRYNTTVSALRRDNRITSSIRPGEILVIRLQNDDR